MTRAIVFTSSRPNSDRVGRTAGQAGVDQFADDEGEGQAEKAGQHQGDDGADELQPVRPDVGRQPGGLAQALAGDFRAGQVVALVARVAAGTGHAEVLSRKAAGGRCSILAEAAAISRQHPGRLERLTAEGTTRAGSGRDGAGRPRAAGRNPAGPARGLRPTDPPALPGDLPLPIAPGAGRRRGRGLDAGDVRGRLGEDRRLRGTIRARNVAAPHRLRQVRGRPPRRPAHRRRWRSGCGNAGRPRRRAPWRRRRRTTRRGGCTPPCRRIDPADRVLLVLHYLQGLSYREMADVTGEPAGTIKWRTSLALGRMRNLLTAEESHVPSSAG